MATGALVAPDVYYTLIRKICDRYGIFLIYDEVMSGAGRTGKFLAAHHWADCRPDIVALAKGVSGGYAPLGAVLTTDDMVRDLRAMGGFFHGHTYAANPQACAAGSAVLDELAERRLVENAAAMGPLLKQQLSELAGETEIIGDVRGRGLLLAVEIVADQASKKMFPPEADAIARIRERCMENGLILLARKVAGGRYGEWLMVCPPLIIDEAQIEELVGGFRKALLSFRTRSRGSAHSAPAGQGVTGLDGLAHLLPADPLRHFFQTQAVEARDRQRREEAEAPVDLDAHLLHGLPPFFFTLGRVRVFRSPMRDHGLTGPDGARLPRLVTDGDDEIELDVLELLPRLASRLARVDVVAVLQELEHVGVHSAFRVRSGAVHVEMDGVEPPAGRTPPGCSVRNFPCRGRGS